jgi:hypothetical protein
MWMNCGRTEVINKNSFTTSQLTNTVSFNVAQDGTPSVLYETRGYTLWEKIEIPFFKCSTQWHVYKPLKNKD